ALAAAARALFRLHPDFAVESRRGIPSLRGHQLPPQLFLDVRQRQNWLDSPRRALRLRARIQRSQRAGLAQHRHAVRAAELGNRDRRQKAGPGAEAVLLSRQGGQRRHPPLPRLRRLDTTLRLATQLDLAPAVPPRRRRPQYAAAGRVVPSARAAVRPYWRLLLFPAAARLRRDPAQL